MHHDRSAVLEAYQHVRARTEHLAEPLSPEDQTVQSMPDASPTKWHRAHTTWFFENFLLGEYEDEYRPVDQQYLYLFNSYYELAGPRHARPKRGLITRPGIAAVADYRRQVDDRMMTLIARLDDNRWPEAAQRIELGLHHERQHQELLVMDVKHVLSCNPCGPAYSEPPAAGEGSVAPQSWVSFPGGLVEVGLNSEGFAFDNEGPRHETFLRPYKLASRPVTVGAWLEFMADGAYAKPELWLSEGWGVVQSEGWQAPLYWQQNSDGSWARFTLHGWLPVDPREPVSHLSYFEADAFARWTGWRLPSEAEWEAAFVAVPVEGQFLESGVLEPRPACAGARGLQQGWGTVWEWTQSPYSPYPGYRAPAGGAG